MRPRGVKRLFAFPFRWRSDLGANVREEFAFHLDMRAEELEGQGLPADEARAQALREFGDLRRGAAVCIREDERVERQRRAARYLDELRQDVTIAVRMFSRSPGFSRLLAWGLLTGLIGSEDVAREFRKDRDALEAMLEAFRVEAPVETRDEVAVITTLLISAVLGFHLLRPLLVGTVKWNEALDERLRSQLVSAMVELTQRADR